MEEHVRRVRTYCLEQNLNISRAGIAKAIRELGISEFGISPLDLVDDLFHQIAPFGVLTELFSIPDVTDIVVNGPDDVQLDRGDGFQAAGITFSSAEQLHTYALHLAQAHGQRLDVAQPYVDLCLSNGVRLHAVIPPVSGQLTCLSFRIPSTQRMTLMDLVACKSLSIQAANTLAEVVRQKSNFLVVGGTGAGKTTVLRALLHEVPCNERMVIVEDTTELLLPGHHAVNLTTRQVNNEGFGEVSLRDLVRQALRMRPQRIVVGEVRGAEIVDLLSAINTGHSGSASSLHANGPAEVLRRIAMLGHFAGLSPEGTLAQFAAGMNYVISCEFNAYGKRRVTSLSEVRERNGVIGIELIEDFRHQADAGGKNISGLSRIA